MTSISISADGIKIQDEKLQKIFVFGHRGSGKSLLASALSQGLTSLPEYFYDDAVNIPAIIEFTNPSSKLEILSPLLFPKAAVYIICFSIARFLAFVKPPPSSPVTPNQSSRVNTPRSNPDTLFFQDYWKLLSFYVLPAQPEVTTISTKVIFVGTFTDEDKNEFSNMDGINDLFQKHISRLLPPKYSFLIHPDKLLFFPFRYQKKQRTSFPSASPVKIDANIKYLAEKVSEYFRLLREQYCRLLGTTARHSWEQRQEQIHHLFTHDELKAFTTFSYSEWIHHLWCSYGWQESESIKITNQLIKDRLITLQQELVYCHSSVTQRSVYTPTLIVFKPLSFISQLSFALFNIDQGGTTSLPQSQSQSRSRSTTASTTTLRVVLPESTPSRQRSTSTFQQFSSISSSISRMISRSFSQSVTLVRNDSNASFISINESISIANTSQRTEGHLSSKEMITRQLLEPIDIEYFNNHHCLSNLYFHPNQIAFLEQVGMICPVGKRNSAGSRIDENSETMYYVLPFILSEENKFKPSPREPKETPKFTIYIGMNQIEATEVINSIYEKDYLSSRVFASFPRYFQKRLFARIMSQYFQEIVHGFEIMIEPQSQYYLTSTDQLVVYFHVNIKNMVVKPMQTVENTSPITKLPSRQCITITFDVKSQLYRIDFSGQCFYYYSSRWLEWIKEQFEETLQDYLRYHQIELPVSQPSVILWLPENELDSTGTTISRLKLKRLQHQSDESKEAHFLFCSQSQWRWQTEFSYRIVKRYCIVLPFLATYFYQQYQIKTLLAIYDPTKEEEEIKKQNERNRSVESAMIQSSEHAKHRERNRYHSDVWLHYMSLFPIISHLSRYYVTIIFSNTSEIQEECLKYVRDYSQDYYQTHYQIYRKKYHPLQYYHEYSRNNLQNLISTSLSSEDSKRKVSLHHHHQQQFFETIVTSYAVVLMYDLQELRASINENQNNNGLFCEYLFEWFSLIVIMNYLSDVSHLQVLKVIIIDNYRIQSHGNKEVCLFFERENISDYFHQLIIQLFSEEVIKGIDVTMAVSEVCRCCKEYLQKVQYDYQMDDKLKDRYEELLKRGLKTEFTSSGDIIRSFSYLLGSFKQQSFKLRVVEIISDEQVKQLQECTSSNYLAQQLLLILSKYSYGREFPFPRHRTVLERIMTSHPMLLEVLFALVIGFIGFQIFLWISEIFYKGFTLAPLVVHK